MKPVACDRSWEAEAIADGRLSDIDRVSFERHAATCSVCREERAALARLDARLRELPPTANEPMRRQRVRRRLMQSAGEHARPRVRWYLVPLIAALACAAAFAMRAHAPTNRPHPPVTAVETPAPAYEVENVHGAVWTETTLGGVARVALTSGQAGFHVHKLQPGQRFLVSLPDGEIEVHGTRFTVVVEERRTHDVNVTEGVVSLRLRDAPPRTLLASEHWSAEAAAPTTAAPTTVAVVASSATIPPPEPIASQRVAPMPTSASSTGAVASISTGAVASTSTSHADDFVLGMAAFQRGDYAEADRLFASFSTRGSPDSRIEDAAYLRAVAHARAGDSAGAARLAKVYLDTFPNGLRRREAAQFVTDQ